ncbi:MAG: YIP1 family protein [Oscillochloris sp.]|nr:YIP1 family protein [Oscillochloris sp.]
MTQQVSIPEMVRQSQEIISNPSVSTFERYERHGNMTSAAIYIAIAAAISGVIGLTGGLGGFLSAIIGTLIGFFVFTGLVYYLGKQIAGGTGSWDEVAYTFALFSAPLYVIGALLGLIVWVFGFIPLLNVLVALAALVVGLIILLAQAYFAYLAVQSSMNIHDQSKAIITLVLSVIGSFIVQAVIGAIL